MRWPFVSRALYDGQCRLTNDVRETLRECNDHRLAALARVEASEARLDRQEARHEADMVRSEARYADLMVSYRMLRLQGFAPPTPEPVVKPAEKPDPVLAAINSTAKDARTRALMLKQAKIDEEAGLSPVEIVQRIHRGNRPAEEIA